MDNNRKKAYEICIEMLEQREYIISEQLDDKIIAIKPNQSSVIVFFIEANKLGVGDIKDLVGELFSRDLDHMIIVYRDSVTPATKKFIENIVGIKIELFSEINLQFNITRHVLQPKSFEKLPDTEAREFKKTFGIKFPVLKHTGPIAAFFDFEKGDIIKITRKNGLVVYRIVK